MDAETAPRPAELVACILAGDRDAEARLVAHFGRGVRVLVRHLTNDGSHADDLFQETFRRAIEKIRAGELREPERLAAFLAGLARNLAIGEYRKRAAHPTAELDTIAEPAAPELDPRDWTLQREEARWVRQLLAELEPERDRQILFRFYLGDESKERLCAEYGLSSLHFNRVVHRARERFRTLVAGARLGYAGSSPHSTRRGERGR